MSWKDLRDAGIGGPVVGYDISHPVVTPSVFRTELGRARSMIDALGIDIARESRNLEAEFRAGWSDFIYRWGAFLADHQNAVLSSFTGGAYEQILDFEREALTWRQSFRDTGGRLTTPEPQPAEPSQRGGSNNGLMWGGVVVLGIFGVGYALSHIPRGGGGSE